MTEYATQTVLDYAELYRQNYQDALDEIRNLKYRIEELEITNRLLEHQLNIMEKHIVHYSEEN